MRPVPPASALLPDAVEAQRLRDLRTHGGVTEVGQAVGGAPWDEPVGQVPVAVREPADVEPSARCPAATTLGWSGKPSSILTQTIYVASRVGEVSAELAGQADAPVAAVHTQPSPPALPVLARPAGVGQREPDAAPVEQNAAVADATAWHLGHTLTVLTSDGGCCMVPGT